MNALANSLACPLVVAVVLNYKCAAQTILCVQRLRKSNYPNLSIVVVDNASGDTSLQDLTCALPDTPIIANERNLGYGDGNNAGIREAARQGAAFVWIVTPDVVVSDNALTTLVHQMNLSPTTGICGPVIEAGEVCIVASLVRRHYGYYPMHVVKPKQELETLEPIIQTDYVDGCAILLRKSMLEGIGLFRDDLFLYFDETELCLRAADAGWKTVVCRDAVVSTRSMSEERNSRDFYMVRNSIAIARCRRKFLTRTLLRNIAMPFLSIARLQIRSLPGQLQNSFRGIIAGLSMHLRTPPTLNSTDQ